MYSPSGRSEEFVPSSESFDVAPPRARFVRERSVHYNAGDGSGKYEHEGSERRTLGSIRVAPDVEWFAALMVPIPDATVAFLSVERHGPLPADYRGGQEAADVCVPIGELEALLAGLTALAEHARRDGVLPPGPAADPSTR